MKIGKTICCTVAALFGAGCASTTPTRETSAGCGLRRQGGPRGRRRDPHGQCARQLDGGLWRSHLVLRLPDAVPGRLQPECLHDVLEGLGQLQCGHPGRDAGPAAGGGHEPVHSAYARPNRRWGAANGRDGDAARGVSLRLARAWTGGRATVAAFEPAAELLRRFGLRRAPEWSRTDVGGTTRDPCHSRMHCLQMTRVIQRPSRGHGHGNRWFEKPWISRV